MCDRVGIAFEVAGAPPVDETPPTSCARAARGSHEHVVIEVRNLGRKHKDLVENVEDYARVQIPEYFSYDCRSNALRGWRLPDAGAKTYVPVVPQGAFYVYADSSRLATDSFKLAGRILQESHVAVTPGRDFGVAAPEAHIRFAYTQPTDRIAEALERMKKVIPT